MIIRSFNISGHIQQLVQSSSSKKTIFDLRFPDQSHDFHHQ